MQNINPTNHPHKDIDILLVYDHFNTDNLIDICADLSKQILQSFNLLLLIDPIHAPEVMDILQHYPNLTYKIYQSNLFDSVGTFVK